MARKPKLHRTTVTMTKEVYRAFRRICKKNKLKMMATNRALIEAYCIEHGEIK